MKPAIWRAAIGGAIGCGVVLTLGVAALLAGARVNTTRSIPVGLYWASDEPVSKGRYVMFCPPEITVIKEARERGYIGAGFCPGGYGYMMKRVLASQNDVVGIDANGVRVNGTLLPFSVPIAHDAHGRELTAYHIAALTLNEQQFLLMADDNPLSFDARYFGPVQRSNIGSVIKPVLTW